MPIDWVHLEPLHEDDPLFSSGPHFVFKNEPKTSSGDTPEAEQEPKPADQ